MSEFLAEVLGIIKSAGHQVTDDGVFTKIDGLTIMIEDQSMRKSPVFRIGDKTFRPGVKGLDAKKVASYILVDWLPARRTREEKEERAKANCELALRVARDLTDSAAIISDQVQLGGIKASIFPHIPLTETVHLSWDSDGLVLRIKGLSEEKVRQIIALK